MSSLGLFKFDHSQIWWHRSAASTLGRQKQGDAKRSRSYSQALRERLGWSGGMLNHKVHKVLILGSGNGWDAPQCRVLVYPAQSPEF